MGTIQVISLGLSVIQSRNVTNNASVRDRNRNILFDVFTLKGIMKPNLNEVFILSFFAIKLLISIVSILFILYI